MRRQDISVLLLYYLGYSRLRNYIFRIQRKPAARFVAFHDLQHEELKCFESNLEFLKENTNVINLDDYFSDRLSFKKINVIITFDDGFKNWVKYAIPILKRLNLPAIFFVSSGFVGLAKEDEAQFVRSNLLLKKDSNHGPINGLSLEDLKKIIDEGFNIGGHTLNHSNLSRITDQKQLRHEIFEDKRILEGMAETGINYFAYPLGAYSNPVVDVGEVLKQAGYRGAVTTEPGFNTKKTDQYYLRRELTGASMNARVFRARVLGNYDGVVSLKRCLSIFLRSS